MKNSSNNGHAGKTAFYYNYKQSKTKNMTQQEIKAIKQAKKEYKKLVSNKQGHERVRTAVVKHILSYKDRVKFNLVLN